MSKYTDLITNYHHGKPKFVEHIDLSTRALNDISTALNNLVSEFDIDNAIGVQQDVLGEWIGRSRTVSTPITGVYFSLDTKGLGFDQGLWQGPYDPDAGKTSLTDETYQAVLKAKIAINHWNGQNGTLPAIVDNALSGTGLRMQIVDNQDITISIWISAVPGFGTITIPDNAVVSDYAAGPFDNVSRELMAVIRAGYLTVKAAGVFSDGISTPSDGYQFFGLDVDNDYIAGFDEGAWGVKF